MWILSSYGRHDRIRKVVDSYAWTDEKVILALCVTDKRAGEYLAQSWPAQFRIEIVNVEFNGPTYNEILRLYPDEPNYGFLADDAILEVPGMLLELERAAGDWNVAYANDQHHKDTNATMPCIGGELVRAAGYLAPPKFMHWAIDNVWHEIGRRLGVLRYFEQLTYRHEHPFFGFGALDKTYVRTQVASMGWENFWRQWLFDGGVDQVMDNVQRLRKAA